MKVNRERLLSALEMVKPGLAPKGGGLEQATHFIFQNNKIITFNGEIACSYKSPINVTGAIQAEPLIGTLSKMKEEILDVKTSDNELTITGKNKQAVVVMDAKIVLPLANLDPPKKWKKLPKRFADAIGIVGPCAGRDEADFQLTCIHLHPEWMEAYDTFQLGRYRMKMGLKESVLVRQSSLSHVMQMAMIKYSLTKSWIHFKSKRGLVLSCTIDTSEYPDDLTIHTKEKGEKVYLPKGIADACAAAEVFSSHDGDKNQIHVNLKPDRIVIKGIGALGRYTESRKIKYAGPELNFMIAPKLLMELVKKYNECEVNASVLKVDGGVFTFITSVEQPPKKIATESKKKKKKVKK